MLLISAKRSAYHGRKCFDWSEFAALAAGSLPIRKLVSPENHASRNEIVFDSPGASWKGTNNVAPGLGPPSVSGARGSQAPSATSFQAIVSASHQPPRNHA